MRIINRKEIEAVHQKDLRLLLENLGFLEKFDSKMINCHSCEEVVREDNFGAVYPEDNRILFACSKLDCLARVASLQR